METEAARYLTYKAMDLQDKGEDAIWQSSAAKAYATDMAIRVTSKGHRSPRRRRAHGGLPLGAVLPRRSFAHHPRRHHRDSEAGHCAQAVGHLGHILGGFHVGA